MTTAPGGSFASSRRIASASAQATAPATMTRMVLSAERPSVLFEGQDHRLAVRSGLEFLGSVRGVGRRDEADGECVPFELVNAVHGFGLAVPRLGEIDLVR